ncbi:hypothetical protein BG015_002244 [Linnemannia schmuckeri]|uniref:Protein kinase domain-containing protein n=1 Tax=Linnemannia schmuckeri TaxID=64567 RepID=A0A9P5RP98_9FUNG|nr:hypothetical protein BG015_002244 [Linnemannia schmuckeri]
MTSNSTTNKTTPAPERSRAVLQEQRQQQQQGGSQSSSATTTTIINEQPELADVAVPKVFKERAGFLHPYKEYIQTSRTYTVIAFVASGSFGSVYQARCGNKMFAIKAQLGGTPYKENLFKGEVLIKHHIGCHDNIIRSFGAFMHHDHLCIRLEWVPLTLRRAMRMGLTLGAVKAIVKGLAEGLKYLHSKHVIHRDMKEGNVVLLQPSLMPLIIDFGLSARVKGHDDLVVRRCGTERNWAPEIRNEEAYGLKVDTYALGLILDRRLNKTAVEKTETFEEIKAGLDLVAKLSCDLPKIRFSAEEALLHPFLVNVVGQEQTVKVVQEGRLPIKATATVEAPSEVQTEVEDDTAGQREEEVRARTEAQHARGSKTRGGSLSAVGVAV